MIVSNMSDSEDEPSELSCTKCNKSINDDNFLRCDGMCNAIVHVDCSDIRKSVAKTIKSCNSVKWLCEVCNTANSIILPSIKQAIENILNTKFTELYSKFEQDKQIILETILNNPSNFQEKVNINKPTPSKKQSDTISQQNITMNHGGGTQQLTSTKADYSTVARTNKVVKQDNSLFIKLRDSSQSSEELCKKIKSSVNPANLSIAVNRVKTTNNGILINCDNAESVNKLKDTLMPQLEAHCDLTLSKSITPKLIVYGTEKNDEPVDDVALANDILKANNIDSDQPTFLFKIVRKINSDGLVNLIIAVDPKTRAVILKKGHLYVNWTRCRVNDSFHIKRCNTCCSFGHLSASCTSKFPICRICAEGHEDKVCSSSVNKCANCIRSNNQFKTSFDINHAANYNKCPCYLNKLNIIKNRTLGTPSV